jgi:DNA-binding IclR family transcriptional regulator
VSQVPAATRTLRVLRFLATQADPVPLDRIVRACDLPRSTAYHLLNTMIDEGFVVHLPEEHRYGLGVAAVVEERAPGRPPLVTDVGVRLPAHLTASGRAILAALPASQVRALYPDRAAFVDRHGKGPASLSALRTVLSATRQRGHATEDGEVTPGLCSVAAAVLDHNGHPVAGVAVTFPGDTGADDPRAAAAVTATAERLTRRVSGWARASP